MTDEIDTGVLGERRHLLSLAFRMLGTVAEAEDAVQETYIRWYRMSQVQRDAVEVPRAWLTRVASRVCLDVLGSARMRREQYVGPWLPGEIAEIVGRSPAACRQLASSARRRVHGARDAKVGRAAHDATVRAFAAAARAGDIVGLVAVLDPDVVLRSDGGGIVTAARNPVVGAEKVARFLLGALTKNPAAEVLDQETPDGLGFALWVEGRVTGVVTMDVVGSSVTDVRMVLNPEKLTFWN